GFWHSSRPGSSEPGLQEPSPPGPAAGVDGYPEGHLADPGLRDVVLAKPLPAAKRTGERLLSYVLRLVLVTEQNGDQRHDPLVAPVIELGEPGIPSGEPVRLHHTSGLGGRSALRLGWHIHARADHRG